MLARQADALAERLRLVRGDHSALASILGEVDAYETRMRADVSRYQSQTTNVLWQLEKRGQRFFDELVRVSNVMRLRDKDVVENRFRNEVVADAPRHIEEEVQALIDWLVRQNLAMWEKADGMLRERREALRDAAARTRFVSPQYVYNREEIFTRLAQPVRRRLERFDAQREADDIYAASSSAPEVATVTVAGAYVTVTAVGAGAATVTVTVTDPGGRSVAQSFAVTVSDRPPGSFADDPIQPGVTPIRAVHFTELRARIDGLREAASLERFPWTDPVLTAGVTRVRRVHLTELREALAQAYVEAGRPLPVWTDAAPAVGSTPIRAAHLMELRTAVTALE